MEKHILKLSVFLLAATISLPLITGCGGNSNRDSKKILKTEDVSGNNNGGGSGTGSGSSTGGSGTLPTDGSTGLHSIFSRDLGVPISSFSIGAIDPDPTGHTLCADYDGDGIPNNSEVISSPFVADYAKIVTRISPPITMEIRVSLSTNSENHSETIEDTDVQNTINNSMENKQYTQANLKTTPYVTKESYSDSESHSEAFGESSSYSVGGSASLKIGSLFGGTSGSASFNKSQSNSKNESVSDSLAKSAMSEKTIFQDVDYVDNLDRNGIEFKNNTIQKISQNYRKSQVLKEIRNIGPNDGYVRAALFIKNLTVNIPVKISNVTCTLSFRTPSGEYLPVKTFKLRNEDYSEFTQEVYGSEELGPYTVEVSDLNTNEVMKALKNGYVPQIHIVNYDMRKVSDSNYNPGVDNLKIVEETAKGRTALIKITGENVREIFRVAAFDVNANGDIIPGISLKKALFNIFKSRISSGEQWVDSDLTVSDAGLRWKTKNPEHRFISGKTGNSWDMFETYIKSYIDENNQVHNIETIKRIGGLKKYNPFDIIDNPSYNPNELLSKDEINKMKYWVIYHNGRYFQGDINDPIWAGERYEIVCIDTKDFNSHFDNYYYNPIQSGESVILDTRWNRLNQDDYFKRAKYIGKIIKGDVIHLEVDLLQSKFLFNPRLILNPVGLPALNNGKNNWSDNIFNYTFQPKSFIGNGIPGKFNHYVTGGINNLTVEVEDSQFAQSYEISFGVLNTPVASWKTVRIFIDNLIEKSNKITITRNTTDIHGNPVGFINGGQTYDSRVKATGNAYGYPVTTTSLTSGTADSRCIVNNVNPGVFPGSFSFKASGLLNIIDVRIQASQNTEYYSIQYQGPFNYNSGGGDPAVKIMIGRPGINLIHIDNPAGEVLDPGVYKVSVYAINNNNAPVGLVSASGEEYTLVNYERYMEQKKYSASISTDYFDLTSLDLEVNFNDGKGWYRLKLSGNDDGNRVIDCRYTSYYEQDSQKFHVFFRPPTGIADPLNPTTDDVFSGGRQEADVFLRTVAENRYRDTLWLKKTAAPDYYISTGSDVTNFINYWISSPYSDASLVENTIYGNNGDFTLSSNNINNYFFSPLENRVYGIKTILTDSMPAADTSPIDNPAYRVAVSGDSMIQVNDMSSVYAYKYIVYWLYVDGYSDSQINNLAKDNFLDNWNHSLELLASGLGSVGSGTNKYDIIGLIPNRKYVIAVKAFNTYGKVSKAVFLKEKVNTIENVLSYIPVTYFPPAKMAGINLGLATSGTAILVDRIYIPDTNIEAYDLQWGHLGSTAVTGTDHITSDGINYASYTIQSLNLWDRYWVQARAIRKATHIPGPWSDPVMIETMDVDNDSITLPSITSNVNGILWKNRPNPMVINLSSLGLPSGSTGYKIDYTLTLIYDPFISSDINLINKPDPYLNIVKGLLTNSSQISYSFNTRENPIYNARWYWSGGNFWGDDCTNPVYSITNPSGPWYLCQYSLAEEAEYKPTYIYLDLTVKADNQYGETVTRDFHFTVLP